MRDSLPVQLRDTMLSSKQPVSTHEDSLFSITNYMILHRSTCLSEINGCYMQLLETKQVSWQEFAENLQPRGVFHDL